ncbi:MAG: hypothetical protein FWE95_09210 [Planctomycetaceae bacterium]|nr:hypothetical protein [Planctomycetaceae bacterium]
MSIFLSLDSDTPNLPIVRMVLIFGKIRKRRGDFPSFFRYTRYDTVPLILLSYMSAIDSLFSTPTANTSVSTGADRLNDLTMSDFIKMMVAQLENQDPMAPMSNTEMLQQMSQMRAITANDRLTESIESLTMGQALSTASSLIGKTVTGMNTLDQSVTGKVDKVTIENGEAKLYVGSSIISAKNVTAIVDMPTEAV